MRMLSRAAGETSIACVYLRRLCAPPTDQRSGTTDAISRGAGRTSPTNTSPRHCAPLSHLAESVPESRDALTQLIKIRLWNDQDIHGRAGADRGVSRPFGKQCHFSEVFAATQRRQKLLFAVLLADGLALAVFDHIDAVTQIALPEDNVAGLEVLIANATFSGEPGLRQLGREQQVEEPVAGDPDLAIEPRHLSQVNGAPEQPRGESRDLGAEDLRDRGASPKRADRSQALKAKFCAPPAAHGGGNVDGRGVSLADGMLRRRRNSCARDRLYQSTVAQRPNLALVMPQLQTGIDEQLASLLAAIEFVNDRW